jgi:Lrp/AsnC family leucine-responsive transcriptional regulator
MNEYRELLSDKILALPGVNNSRSYVVIEEVKETSLLPVIRKA